MGWHSRPYRRLGTDALEALFDDGRCETHVLQALADELRFRSTHRGSKLRVRVEDELAARSRPRQPPKIDTPPRGDAPRSRPGTTTPGAGRPMGSDAPASILVAWTALKALSPQTYRRPEDLVGGDRRSVADFKESGLPWERGERSRPGFRLYYQVILGAIPMDRATRMLVDAFGADEERGRPPNEMAAIAVVVVDQKGVPLEKNAIGVSSFAWALPQALQLHLDRLGAWRKVEHEILRDLDKGLRRKDRDGNALPLDIDRVERAFRWLASEFGLPDSLAEPPWAAIRIYHPLRAASPPEAALLNSFFLRDLAEAAGLVDAGEAPLGLRRYRSRPSRR